GTVRASDNGVRAPRPLAREILSIVVIPWHRAGTGERSAPASDPHGITLPRLRARASAAIPTTDVPYYADSGQPPCTVTTNAIPPAALHRLTTAAGRLPPRRA